MFGMVNGASSAESNHAAAESTGRWRTGRDASGPERLVHMSERFATVAIMTRSKGLILTGIAVLL
jgi:phosphoheptose isomerase